MIDKKKVKKIGLAGILLLVLAAGIFITRYALSGTVYAGQDTWNGISKNQLEKEMDDMNMLRETINYTKDGRVNMEIFVHQDASEPLPAIISLPAGAFGMLAYSDKEPRVLTFYEKNFHAFVLNYSVGKYSEFPNPLDEVSWAIWQIRSHAEEWNVDPDKIVVMGFSAGSSVAGMSATQWNTPGLYERVGAPDAESIRPNAAVIGYGAADITNTILDDPSVARPGNWGKIVTDRTPELDIVNYVDENTAPMFIWHCRGDWFVPLKNPLMLAEAMQEHDLAYELHIFSDGYHGMSVGNNGPGGDLEHSDHPNADMWVPLCVNWLNHIL